MKICINNGFQGLFFGSDILILQMLNIGMMHKKIFQRVLFLILSFTLLSINYVKAQYQFQSYPSPDYETHKNWKIYDRIDERGTFDCTSSVDHFFNDKDKLIVQLTWYADDRDFGFIRVFRNEKQIQKIKVINIFSPLTMNGTPVLISDINGDGLKDVKMVHQGTGNGIMGMLVKVVYLFQKKDGKFRMISFKDMMFDENREERDIDDDGNYEIITMNLEKIKSHSYWVFNVYRYTKRGLSNVNHILNYPIIIQYTYKRNYKITKDLNRSQMKYYQREFPLGYDIK